MKDVDWKIVLITFIFVAFALVVICDTVLMFAGKQPVAVIKLNGGN